MFTSPELNAIGGIRYRFFDRSSGISKGIYKGRNCGLSSRDDPALVRSNRASCTRELGVAPGRLATLHQVHGDHIEMVNQWPLATALQDGDGLVTSQPGVAIGVNTADCVPILFFAPAQRIIGAAHAGWRGALMGVAQRTIEKMTESGAQPKEIYAAIGPCLQQQNFEVGDDLIEAFIKDDSKNHRFFSPSGPSGTPHFDLSAYVEVQLQEAGLTKIDRSIACTYETDASYFSYRRATHRKEPDYGRQLSAIALVDTGRL